MNDFETTALERFFEAGIEPGADQTKEASGFEHLVNIPQTHGMDWLVAGRRESFEKVHVHDDSLATGILFRDGVKGTECLDVDALVIEGVFFQVFLEPIGKLFCFGENNEVCLFLWKVVTGCCDAMAKTETEKEDAGLLGGPEGLADHLDEVMCWPAKMLGIDLPPFAFKKVTPVMLNEIKGETGIGLRLCNDVTRFHRWSLRGQEAFLVKGGRYPVEKRVMSEEEQNFSQQPSDSQPASPGQGVHAPSADKKVLAGILAIMLGTLGVHKFVLGYTKEGVIMLIIGLLICWNIPVMAVIGLIEGIIYLTKSDEDFVATYLKGRRGWFSVLYVSNVLLRGDQHFYDLHHLVDCNVFHKSSRLFKLVKRILRGCL